MPLRSSALWLCCALALTSIAASAEGKTAAEIQACVQKNFPADSMVQTVRMVSVDRVGVERLLEADMYWQRNPETGLSNVLLSFDNPPELRGAAVLVLEKKPQNDMFMFLPELGKTRRITSTMVQGNMMGTDFSYEDFQRLQGLITGLDSKKLDDASVGDRKVWVTESTPHDPSSEYTRIVTRVDQETCVPLELELYTKGGAEPAKRMTTNAKSVKQEKTGWMPREIAMKDLRTETSTTIVIEKLQVGVAIERKRFSAKELEKLGRFSNAPSR